MPFPFRLCPDNIRAVCPPQFQSKPRSKTPSQRPQEKPGWRFETHHGALSSISQSPGRRLRADPLGLGDMMLVGGVVMLCAWCSVAWVGGSGVRVAHLGGWGHVGVRWGWGRRNFVAEEGEGDVGDGEAAED